jgi:hypothetical protein
MNNLGIPKGKVISIEVILQGLRSYNAKRGLRENAVSFRKDLTSLPQKETSEAGWAGICFTWTFSCTKSFVVVLLKGRENVSFLYSSSHFPPFHQQTRQNFSVITHFHG